MRELSLEIPESRDLRADERLLVRWLLDHAPVDVSSYLPQIEELRICSRCGCGCASVNFAAGDEGWPHKGGMKVVSDHDWVDADGHECGIFLFEHFGTLAGLDVYSLAGATVPAKLPTIAALEQMLANRAAAAQPSVAADGASPRR